MYEEQIRIGTATRIGMVITLIIFILWVLVTAYNVYKYLQGGYMKNRNKL